MTFSGQTAWITGASSGIGAALSRELAARGAHLVLSGRNVAALDTLAAALPTQTLVLPFETTDYAALPGIAEQAWGWRGGIDLLINNAGISQRSLAQDTAFGVYERIIAVDLLAPIALTQAILPRMIAQRVGRLAFITSVAGKVGMPMRTGYCAAKFGLTGYADALRVELAIHDIAVHVIAPGSIRTDVSRNALTADGSPRGESDAAIEAGLDPDDAARAMCDAMAAGTREIFVAEGMELAMAEATRTPDALFDRLAAMMAQGYAERMKAGT